MLRRDFLKYATGASAIGGLGLASPSLALEAAADFADDLDILRRALALHPGLHRYLSPDDVEAGLAQLEQDVRSAATLAHQYLALSRFLATIRCGHTYCNFYNQSDTVALDLFDRHTRLPFRFIWLDGEMVVLSGETGAEDLVPGERIVVIDGVRPCDLLATLLPYARADGGNDGKRIAQMGMRNTARFETFDIFQGLIAPPGGDAFQVTVQSVSGALRTLSLPALSLAERQAGLGAEAAAGEDGALWSFSMQDDVAVLSMPSWAVFNSDWDWRTWLNARLDNLAGARGLVIDLRDNEGGLDCGDPILARLAASDLRFRGYESRVRFATTPADLDPYLDTWDDSFRSAGAKGVLGEDGFYRRPGPPPDGIIAAAGPQITLPVAALIGPNCSSATFVFAQRAKQSGLIRLFGTETGGNRRGINGGSFFFVRLPASGLEFDLPIVGYFPLQDEPDAGVRPDTEVAVTPADIAESRDRCLDQALAWCRSA